MNALLTGYLHTFLWLLVAHALCDYPLQGEFLAKAKRPGGVPGVPWQWAMWAHCSIHAGAVWAITGSLELGVLEFCAHALIDYWKCTKGWATELQARAFTLDQLWHLCCKAWWVWLLIVGWVQ